MQGLIKEMKLSFVNGVWLWQNRAVFVIDVLCESVFEFLIVVDNRLHEFRLGHFHAVVDLDGHLLLLLEDEFVV
jgi:hypothetical protein